MGSARRVLLAPCAFVAVLATLGSIDGSVAAAPPDSSVPPSEPTVPAPPPVVTLPPPPASATPFPGLRPVPRTLPPIDDPAAASAPLVPIPVGCPTPPQAQMVFVGTVVLTDPVTARFRLEQVLAGSAVGFEVGGLIDVRYGDETGFIERGERYVVGAAVDPRERVLASTARPPAPLFGGDEIAGVNDDDLTCPAVESPIRTLMTDGTPVDTGVLSSLDGAGGRLLRAVLLPVGVAFLVILGLVVLKHLVFALGRASRDIAARPMPDPADDVREPDSESDDQPVAVP
jgi:hypothetical protein